MSEKNQAERPIPSRRENLLIPVEAQVLRLADRGELPCPRCGQRLWGDQMFAEEIYAGVVLVCLSGCGFREY